MLLKDWLSCFRKHRGSRRPRNIIDTPRLLEDRTLLSAYSYAAVAWESSPMFNRDLGTGAHPTLRDLDADGDLDNLSGNAFGQFFYYRNNGTSAAPTFPPQSQVTTGASINPLRNQDVGDGSYLAWGDLDGDLDLDLLVGNQQGGFSYYRNTGSTSNPAFTIQAGANNPMDGEDVGLNSTPTLGDLDGDGDLDLIVGEREGGFSYYANTGSASSPIFTEQTGTANPLNGVSLGAVSLPNPTLVNLDGDADLDLVIGQENATLLYFKNTGTSAAPVFTQQLGAANPWDGIVFVSNPSFASVGSSPAFGDLDGDGDPDLLVGLSNGACAYYLAAPLPSGADLQLSQSVDAPSPALGATVTFTLTITNQGILDASSIEIANAMPAGLTGVVITPSTGTYTAGVWSLPLLSATPGSNTATLTISGNLTAIGTDIVNSAEIIASAVTDPDSTPNNHVATEDDQTTLLIHINAAPILDDSGDAVLNLINQADVNSNGTSIAALVASMGPSGGITDPDAYINTGIAVIGADTANGSWEYSLNSGSSWSPLGSVSTAVARLLPATAAAKIRFVPNSSFFGSISSAITFLAWDQSSGTAGSTANATTTGGATPFSIESEKALLFVNATPTNIALSGNSIAENIAGGVLGTLSATDPNLSDTFTWSILPGGDASQFTLVGNELRVGATGLDFEAGASRSITIRTTDQFGAFFDKLFSIFVTNVNETPSDIALSSTSITEGNSIGAQVGLLSTTDPDAGNTFTYSLVAGTGSTDNASFTISGGQLNAAAVFNAAAKNSYSIRLRSVDQGGLAVENVFTITILEINDPPTDIVLSNNSVPENAGVGSTIGTFSTTDPDTANTFTYTLVSGTGSTNNASFSISGNALQTAVGLNYEIKSSYSIRIRSTDQGGLSTEKTFTINVTNVNESPTNITLSNSTIAENAPVGTSFGSFSSADPDDGNTFTYTLVSGTGSTDNAAFTINGTALQTAVLLNFENKSSYSIRVRSADQGGLPFEKVFTITVTNVNEFPTDITLSNSSIVEGNPVGTSVGTFSTSDPDAANTFTYTLTAGTGSADNASFTISGNTLQSAAVFNASVKSSYSIRVRTTDQNGLTFEKVFTIAVTDANEAPTDIALSPSSIAENNAEDATIGSLSTTDGNVGDTFTYALVDGAGSTDNAAFTIVGNSFRAAQAFNFESKSSYSIRIRSTDSTGLSTEKAFVVSVTDLNEAPIDIGMFGGSLPENRPVGTQVGTVFGIDLDASPTMTYSLVTGVGSTDNGFFSMSGNSLNTAQILDFEFKSSYSVLVRATDQEGLFFDKQFTITLTNVNEAPSDIQLSTSSVPENTPSGSTVGTFSSTDQDGSGVFTYALVTGTGSTDNSSFTISGNSLQLAVTPDFESKSSYSIRVRSTDSTGVSFTKIFLISVTNVNETPVDISLSNNSFPENNSSGSSVGTFSTTDIDTGNTFTYTLVAGTGSTDNASFAIIGNTLQTAASLNFENKSSYSIRVRSTDQGGLSTEKVFTINITNVNESPTDIALSNSSIAETAAVGTNIGTLSTTDPDAANTFAYTLVAGTGSADNASFTISGNTLQTAASFNFENKSSYSIRIRTTDQGGSSFEKAFTINVTNVNETPTDIALSNNSIIENSSLGSSVGTLSTTDPDAGNTFTYTLVAGTGSTDNASFTISGNSLQSATSLNFENKSSYSIRIRSTDQGGLSTEKTFTINITNVNESPTDIALSNSSILEGNPVGTSIGSFSSTDPDTGNTFIYSLVAGTGSTDNASFTISGNTLQSAAIFNAATKSSYSIRVRSTDQGSLPFEKIFTITVADTNTSPTNITLSSSSIAENSSIGSSVGTLSTTDPDAGNTFTYTLVAGTGSTDNAAFTISSNTLQTATNLNFESKSSYSIRIRTTDQGGLSFEKAFTINVTNVNEGPTDINLSNSSIAENIALGTSVGTLSTIDPDAGNIFTYSLVTGFGSTDNASFTIAGNTLQTAASFNFENKSSYGIRIRTTDQGGRSAEKTFTITVTNINESPSDITLSNNSIPENSSVNSSVGTLSTTDADTGNAFTYTLVTGTGSTDNAAFTISGNTLRTATALNFENKSSYSIRVRSTDQGGLSTEKTFTISVTNVNESPTDIALSKSSMAEGNPVGASIGSFTTSDPDAANTFTYTLVAGTGSTDNAAFTIAGNTLQANVSFNFEAKSSYSIRVRSTDQGGLSIEKTFTINVTDVNEAPLLDSDGAPALNLIHTNIILGQYNVGTLVSDIIARMAPDGGISDVDAGPLQGIAINGLTNTANGTWQFTINNGTTWSPIGTTGNSDARLLAADANTRIRFVPNAGFTGNIKAAFVAWDRSSGTNGGVANVASRGGNTPFSLNFEYATLDVLAPPPLPNALGVWRDGKFYLDANNNRVIETAPAGDLVYPFGTTTDTPLIGDWNGDGLSDLGVWRTGKFYLDANANRTWNNTAGGDLLISFGATTDLPISGDWNGDGKTDIGSFREGKFYLDSNGNRKWDGTTGGDQIVGFGTAGDLPVIGDWNGDSVSDLGIIRNGKFYLDINGNRAWNNIAGGDAYFTFGTAGDKPVVGDWNNDGKSDVGIVRNGTFYLDTNANRKWNNTTGGDSKFTFGSPTDTPLTGVWKLPTPTPQHALSSPTFLSSNLPESPSTPSQFSSPVASSLAPPVKKKNASADNIILDQLFASSMQSNLFDQLA